MKKNGILGASLAAALAAAAAPAVAQQNLYGSVQLGIADYATLSNGVSGILTLGMPAPRLGENFAYEAEISTTLTDPDTVGLEVSYITFGGYGVYALPISQQFALRARLGLVYERVEFDFAGFPDERENALRGSTSLGFAYQLPNGIRLIADHTMIGTSIANTGVGVQMSF